MITGPLSQAARHVCDNCHERPAVGDGTWCEECIEAWLAKFRRRTGWEE